MIPRFYPSLQDLSVLFLVFLLFVGGSNCFQSDASLEPANVGNTTNLDPGLPSKGINHNIIGNNHLDPHNSKNIHLYINASCTSQCDGTRKEQGYPKLKEAWEEAVNKIPHFDEITLFISAGTYSIPKNQSLQWSRQDGNLKKIRLIGETAANTILKGDYQDGDKQSTAGFTLKGESISVHLQQLTLSHFYHAINMSDKATATLKDCLVTNNKSGVVLDNAHLHILGNSQFSDNYNAQQHPFGAAIIATQNSQILLNGNILFTRNKLIAITLENASLETQGTETIIFEDHLLGGAIHANRSTLTFKSPVIFKNNINYLNGGALVVSDSDLIFQNHATFTNNKSKGYGGALYFTAAEGDHKLLFENAIFKENQAGGRGPWTDLRGGLPDSAGGGLYIHVSKAAACPITLKKTDFIHNTAYGRHSWSHALYVKKEASSPSAPLFLLIEGGKAIQPSAQFIALEGATHLTIKNVANLTAAHVACLNSTSCQITEQP